MNNILEAREITKSFPGTLALDHVTVSFSSGAVHAILGKNGSGKSTLMKIFSGAYQATSGEIRLNGEVKSYSCTEQALQNGIATVYQELSVIKDLTVAENLFVGKLPMKNKVKIDWKSIRSKAKETLEYLGVDIDLNAYIKDLPIGQQQLVEIAKAMSSNPDVLILDEPTSALSDTECEKLFSVVADLKKKGLIILFISHRLQEIFKIADYVTVLRDGVLIGTEKVENLDSPKLIHMMFGDVKHNTKEKSYATDEIVLEVKNLRNSVLNNVSFQLKKGEILGIAGMLGAGRTEILRAIYGLDHLESGEIWVKGERVKRPSPSVMKGKRCGFTSENRKDEGLCQKLSIGDNLVLANLKSIAPRGHISKKKELDYISRQIEGLSIKVSDYHLPVSSLSGGNQQKVVVGNWLNTKPEILFLDEPSRGIDVNAKQQIFSVIWDEASQGVGVIIVSSELEELLEVCDRILVMRHGCITEEKKASELTVESIYSLCMQEDETI